ncbi:hypothetical protein BAU67_001878 [Escherichia coli]|nr:hypothetical protein [Escherichia coli]
MNTRKERNKILPDVLDHMMKCRSVWHSAKVGQRVVVVSDNSNPFGNYLPTMEKYIQNGIIEVVRYEGLHDRHFENTLLVEL